MKKLTTRNAFLGAIVAIAVSAGLLTVPAKDLQTSSPLRFLTQAIGAQEIALTASKICVR